MRLFSNRYGDSGVDMIIIHGLFGMSDNWNTLGKKFREDFKVHLLDLRNHGKSPHSDNFNYDVMCADLLEYMMEHNIQRPIIIGHSLGGKVAMKFAFTYPGRIEKLIVVDISPRRYNTDFVQNILQKLYKLPLDNFKKRGEIDVFLSSFYQDKGMRSFLLKNLYRKKNNEFAWRFNIEVLLDKVSNIQEAGFVQGVCDIPTYFIKGGKSNYITNEDKLIIDKYFSDSSILIIDDAGHWLHADQPEEFYKKVIEIIKQE